MATPEERRKAKQLARENKSRERVLRRANRLAAKAQKRKDKKIAKDAAKTFAAFGDDKAYCTTCRKWYDPRKPRENRKHNHLK